MQLYGFIYITENLLSGKRYIGQRAYSKGWENYLGSGKILLRAVKAHGRANFVRTIIYEGFTKEALDDAERKIIQALGAIDDPDFYNLAPGGHGASRGFLGKRHTAATREKMRQSALGHPVSDKTREAVKPNILKAQAAAAEYRKIVGYPTGAQHSRSKSVSINGVSYASISSAVNAGYRIQDIRKHIAGSILEIYPYRANRPAGSAKSVTIEGVFYPSIVAAMAACNLTRKQVLRIREEQEVSVLSNSDLRTCSRGERC